MLFTDTYEASVVLAALATSAKHWRALVDANAIQGGELDKAATMAESLVRRHDKEAQLLRRQALA